MPRADGCELAGGDNVHVHVRNHGYHFHMPINFEIRQQPSCIICIQFKLRANKMTQLLKSTFSPDQSVLYASEVLLNCCMVAVP